jgi:hypothetical protein
MHTGYDSSGRTWQNKFFALQAKNRGDWQNFKREVQPYAAAFLHGPKPHILRIG